MLCAGPDMSHTMRLKIRKARALANYRRQNPGKPELGPGWQTTPESLRTVRAFGQMPIIVMTEGLQLQTLVPCGCPAETP
jgi:hypothetical protein